MDSYKSIKSDPECSISVVIPLYNKRVEIERTLHSVLRQTFTTFEVIIVNDGSTDGSDLVAEQIRDPRIQVFHQKNAGVSAARNRGIAQAKGELIAFLDADDEWKTTFLEVIWKLRKLYPYAGIYGTAYERHLPNGHVKPISLTQLPNAPWNGIIPNYFQTAVDDLPLWSSAVAVPKAVFLDVGDFPVGVKLGEDIDMWLRIALKYPVAYDNSVQAVYHLAASNRALQTYRCNENLVMANTAERAIAEGHVSGVVEEDLREYVYMFQLLTATECAKAGNLAQARELLKACHKTKRFRNRWIWWRIWTAMPLSIFNLIWKSKRKLLP